MTMGDHSPIRSLLTRLRPQTTRGRITYGLLTVLVLHSAVVILSHFGLQRAAKSAERSATVKQDVTTLLNRNHDVIALQSNVLSFMYTGDKEMAARVRADASALKMRLKTLYESEAVVDPTELEPLLSALGEYTDKLESVIASRGRRETIMRESVDPVRRHTVDVLTRAMEASTVSGKADLAVEFAASLRLFMRAEACIAAYLSDPGGETADEFRRIADQFHGQLTALPREGLGPSTAQELAEIEAGLPAWKSSVFQAVNATRSFLHLVNVVLAGHALEFRTVASNLKDKALLAQNVLDARLRASQRRFLMMSNVIGAVTLLAGLLAGWWISRSVSGPIIQMTRAFSDLAKGETADLGGLLRQGDIGELATAAEVFAERNHEAERHLAMAEELSRIQASTNIALHMHVEELKLRNDELDSFSYSASHDLRAPLRSIALLAEWIEEDSGELLPEECRGHLATLQSRATRLENLLDGLLEYSRVGRIKDLSEPLELRSFIEESIEGLGSETGANIDIRGEALELVAPKVALQKVIQNLVSNGISHHDGDCPNVTVEIEKEDAFAVLKVTDDGPGIEPSLHEKIFQIFQTGKPRDQHEANGVGLAIVQKITVAHGAEVTVDSDGVRGTTITVRWPLERPHQIDQALMDPPAPFASQIPQDRPTGASCLTCWTPQSADIATP